MSGLVVSVDPTRGCVVDEVVNAGGRHLACAAVPAAGRLHRRVLGRRARPAPQAQLSSRPSRRPRRSASSSPSTSASDSPSAATSSSAPTRPPSVRVSATIASNLTAPWGVALLSDGSALVAERDSGRVLHVRTDGTRSTAGTVPGAVHATGAENGLLGLAVRPHDDSMVWAYESTSGGNRVVRMTYSNGALGEPRTILDGIPTAAHHNGGRLVFGPDGDLYVGTGDAEVRPRAQDKSSLGGKILRIEPDGSVPSDNPFSGSPVWSYGHRNVQGLAFDSAGRLWATEFGQDTWDELNLIVKGGNYGWPVVEGDQAHAGFREPEGPVAHRRRIPQRPRDRRRRRVRRRAQGPTPVAGGPARHRCRHAEGLVRRHVRTAPDRAWLQARTCGSPRPTPMTVAAPATRTTGSCGSRWASGAVA